MKIDVGTVWCKISEAELKEIIFVREYLRFEIEGARFTPAYKKGWWDGKINLYYKNDMFPIGMLRNVAKASKEEGYEVILNDRRIAPCITNENADLAWLRPYQKVSVKHCEDNVNGILWMATGGGKTEVAIALMLRLPCRWLFLADSLDLVMQGAARFEKRTGETAGVIADGRWEDQQRVTFATFQTLDRALDRKKGNREKAEAFLGGIGGLVVDEAHMLGADSFWDVAMACKNAYYRVGISATPLARGDKRSVFAVAALGPVLHRVRATTLIDLGYLAAPVITMVPFRQNVELSNWKTAERKLIVESKERNKLLCEMCLKAEKPGLLFTDAIAHGRVMTKALQHLGLNVDFVHGENETIQRKNAVDKLERGDLDFIVSSKVFKKGIDIPDLRSIVVGCGGKSKISAIQMLGRGSRKPDGKNSFQVWDILDRGNKWISKHARERYNAYESEGYQVKLLKEGESI